jgi:excisionase family DNA binding protein
MPEEPLASDGGPVGRPEDDPVSAGNDLAGTQGLVPNSMEQFERLLKVDAVCNWFGVEPDWVYDEVEAGRLPFIRLGRRNLRFLRSQLQEYLQLQSQIPSPRSTTSSGLSQPPEHPTT